MRVLILSDIHGNITALDSVLNDVADKGCESLILLGDVIDYGMHSNEVIERLIELSQHMKVIGNIRGNHEDAVIHQDYSRFSSDRGRHSAQNTRIRLNEQSWGYISKCMSEGGKNEIEFTNRHILLVHGSMEDALWKSITPDIDVDSYADYDIVLSGHSHIPHYFEKYISSDDKTYRNKKKIIFLNPGSVGQPRNHNPNAQYAIWDTDTDEFLLKKVAYDVRKEQDAFDGSVDDFYRNRLELGI